MIPPIRGGASIIEKNTPSIIGGDPPIHQGAYTTSIEEMHRRLAPDDNTRVYSAPHRLLPIEEQETFNPMESLNGAPGTSKKKKVDSGSAVNYYNSNVRYSGDLLKRRKGVPTTGFGTPVAFSDASNDSDPYDGLSQAGFVIQMCLGPIVFSSKKLKHKSPTGSASHCEYMALCACNQAVIIWLRQLLYERDFQEILEESAPVYGDNRHANELCKEDLITSGTQYIYLPYHFNKEVQELGYMYVQDIRTGIDIADLMTKPVPASKIRDLCGSMLGYEWVDYVA